MLASTGGGVAAGPDRAAQAVCVPRPVLPCCRKGCASRRQRYFSRTFSSGYFLIGTILTLRAGGPPIFQIVEPRTIAVRIAKSVTLAGPGRTNGAIAVAARPGTRKTIISVTLNRHPFHFCKTYTQ